MNYSERDIDIVVLIRMIQMKGLNSYNVSFINHLNIIFDYQ